MQTKQTYTEIWHNVAQTLELILPKTVARNHSQNIHSQDTKHGVPVVAQWLTNPTRNHEVVGLIPGLAQWVGDLALS